MVAGVQRPAACQARPGMHFSAFIHRAPNPHTLSHPPTQTHTHPHLIEGALMTRVRNTKEAVQMAMSLLTRSVRRGRRVGLGWKEWSEEHMAVPWRAMQPFLYPVNRRPHSIETPTQLPVFSRCALQEGAAAWGKAGQPRSAPSRSRNVRLGHGRPAAAAQLHSGPAPGPPAASSTCGQ